MSLKYEAKLTNIEIVNNVMKFSPHGAISQVFVIEAIRYYCNAVLSQPRPEHPGNSFIDVRSWWDTAQYINTRFEDNYSENTK